MEKLINEIIYEDDYEVVRLIDKNTVGLRFKYLYTDEETSLSLEKYYIYYDGEAKCNQNIKNKINSLINS